MSKTTSTVLTIVVFIASLIGYQVYLTLTKVTDNISGINAEIHRTEQQLAAILNNLPGTNPQLTRIAKELSKHTDSSAQYAEKIATIANILALIKKTQEPQQALLQKERPKQQQQSAEPIVAIGKIIEKLRSLHSEQEAAQRNNKKETPTPLVKFITQLIESLESSKKPN